jgi:radical SAM protein with 4Fe4S-binding SPASM domain
MGVEISVYSHRSAVFEDVTQRRGSFARTLQGAKLLRERNLPTTIKTPIMRQNVADYQELIALAEEMGAYYTLDPQMVPRNDGDLTPLQYQVDEVQLAALYNDPALYDQPCTVTEGDYQAIMNAPSCGGGRRICVVDPYGEVYGCLQLLRSNGNVRERALADIWWHGASFQEVRGKLRGDLIRCETCPGPPYCLPCMGLSEMEHGSIVGHARVACRQNHLRYQRAMAAQGIEVELPERLRGVPLPATAPASPLTLLKREAYRQRPLRNTPRPRNRRVRVPATGGSCGKWYP